MGSLSGGGLQWQAPSPAQIDRRVQSCGNNRPAIPPAAELVSSSQFLEPMSRRASCNVMDGFDARLGNGVQRALGPADGRNSSTCVRLLRLVAAGDFARLNVGRHGHLSFNDGGIDRPQHLRHRPLKTGPPGRALRPTPHARGERLCSTSSLSAENMGRRLRPFKQAGHTND